MIQDQRVVYGGGSSEINCALNLLKYADEIASVEQYALRGFANALEGICFVLSENSGLNGVETVAKVKQKQEEENSCFYGIECQTAEIADLRKFNVIETLSSKKQQIQLAAEIVKMILKIDDLIDSAL